MKGFFKVVFGVLGFFTAIVGALAVFDKFTNKNRIEGDYLDCFQNDPADETNE